MSFVKETCQPNTVNCCRYLTANGSGFYCAKLDIGFATIINARVEAGTFNATGDNCPGKPSDEILEY